MSGFALNISGVMTVTEMFMSASGREIAAGESDASTAGPSGTGDTGEPQGVGDVGFMGGAARSPHPGSPGDIMLLFLAPCLLSIGIFGNFASFSVMMTAELRRQSTSVYLSCLAVFDTANLCQLFWSYWYGMIGDVSPASRSDWLCKLELVTLRMQATTTAYLIVAVSIERCVATALPFRAATLCTVRNARVVTSVILVLCLTYSVAAVYQFGADSGPCDLDAYFRYFNIAHTKWVLPVLYSVIPTIALIVVNTITSVQLLRQRRPGELAAPGPDRLAVRATKVVLLVALVYLSLTIPATAGLTLLRGPFVKREISVVGLLLFRGSVILLMTNHAINLFLYILISEKFRTGFLQLFCGGWRQKNRKSSTGFGSTIASSGSVKK